MNAPSCCDDTHRQAVRLSRKTLTLPLIAGIGCSFGLLVIYFATLSFVSGWTFTLAQFDLFWPFVIALAVGFGVQVGLFVFLHRAAHAAAQGGKVIAASGTASGVAMVSCCTHYLVNLLPVLGATGLVSLVGQYQVELFWFGLAANLAGVAFMSYRIMSFAKAKGLAGAVVALVLVAGTSFPAVAAEAQVSDEGGVVVTVTPTDLSGTFHVQFNTHTVALDQDMLSSAVLLTGDGEEVRPQSWNGDPPGGHHRAGTLVFAAPPTTTKRIVLKILGVGVPERVFTWSRKENGYEH